MFVDGSSMPLSPLVGPRPLRRSMHSQTPNRVEEFVAFASHNLAAFKLQLKKGFHKF
jgi:hypothetical protein